MKGYSSFDGLRARLMTSHVLLTSFCILAFTSGTFVFLNIYFASFLRKLQILIDSNRGQIPKGQLLSSLEVARDYTDGMDLFLLIGAVVSILAALAVGAVMANRLSRPLRVFTTAIKSLKTNDYARIDLPLTAELSDLQNAFNDLSANLKSMQEMRRC
jgi:methyl-accepting chemotaxis protein